MFRNIWYLTPIISITIVGRIDIIAIVPKPYNIPSNSNALHIPRINGNTNDADRLPAAAPPLSKAIPTNSLGVYILITINNIINGTSINIKLKPSNALSTTRNIAIATPILMPTNIVLFLITPPVISSTCLLST